MFILPSIIVRGFCFSNLINSPNAEEFVYFYFKIFLPNGGSK